MELIDIIKQYSGREDRIRKKNCDKYFFISTILDFMTLAKENGYLKINKNDVEAIVKSWGTYSLNVTVPIKRIHKWVDDMVRMGLIKLEKPKTFREISLTEYGEDAYKKQLFHSMSATMYEAKCSRELAFIAIIIAIASIFVNVITLFCNI